MRRRVFQCGTVGKTGICRVVKPRRPGVVPQRQNAAHGDVDLAAGGVVKFPAFQQQTDDVPVHLHRGNARLIVDGFQVVTASIVIVDIEQLVIVQQRIVDALGGLRKRRLTFRPAANRGDRVEQGQKRGLVNVSPRRSGGAAGEQTRKGKHRKKFFHTGPLHRDFPYSTTPPKDCKEGTYPAAKNGVHKRFTHFQLIFRVKRCYAVTNVNASFESSEERSMSKFSVKKPLTVFVAVIAILVLGVVAYFRMTPDLLPNMDFPYVLIMTTYPGASPEKVEQEITKPMEQAMSTLDHIQEVTSVSSENVGMVILEFTEGVNMDTVGVDIQQEISQLSADWSDTVGTPYVLKINPSMLPVEVAAVSMEGMDTVELTEFLDETLMNKLEGVPGVARITTSGEIEQELHVVLDQKLIDKLNDRIAAAINGELDDAAAELNEKKEELEDAQKKVDGAQSQLSAGVNALIEGEKQLNEKKTELTAMREQLQEQLEQAQTGRQQLVLAYNALKELDDQVNNVLSAQQEAHGYLNTLQSLSDRQSALANKESSLAQLKQDNETLDAEIQALREQIAGHGPRRRKSARFERGACGKRSRLQ